MEWAPEDLSQIEWEVNHASIKVPRPKAQIRILRPKMIEIIKDMMDILEHKIIPTYYV